MYAPTEVLDLLRRVDLELFYEDSDKTEFKRIGRVNLSRNPQIRKAVVEHLTDYVSLETLAECEITIAIDVQKI